MVSKILIDTNVLLDYLLEREPFFDDAKKVILSCTEGNIKGCIAAHSISNMFFILRKDYTANEDFSDFEDCLQMECAKSYGAEYIVTRNVADYSTSEIKAILPSEYLGL